MLNRTLTSHFVRTALGWLLTVLGVGSVAVIVLTLAAYLGTELARR